MKNESKTIIVIGHTHEHNKMSVESTTATIENILEEDYETIDEYLQSVKDNRIAEYKHKKLDAIGLTTEEAADLIPKLFYTLDEATKLCLLYEMKESLT
jgi:hypothetical protein